MKRKFRRKKKNKKLVKGRGEGGGGGEIETVQRLPWQPSKGWGGQN